MESKRVFRKAILWVLVALSLGTVGGAVAGCGGSEGDDADIAIVDGLRATGPAGGGTVFIRPRK